MTQPPTNPGAQPSRTRESAHSVREADPLLSHQERRRDLQRNSIRRGRDGVTSDLPLSRDHIDFGAITRERDRIVTDLEPRVRAT